MIAVSNYTIIAIIYTYVRRPRRLHRSHRDIRCLAIRPIKTTAMETVSHRAISLATTCITYLLSPLRCSSFASSHPMFVPVQHNCDIYYNIKLSILTTYSCCKCYDEHRKPYIASIVSAKIYFHR